MELGKTVFFRGGDGSVCISTVVLVENDGVIIIQLFVKIRAEYQDLISCIGVLIDYIGINQFLPELFPLLKKLG